MKRAMFLVLILLLGLPMSVIAQEDPQDAQAQLVAGSTAFAFDLYQAIRSSTDGNLFYSPYSVSQALAMTYAGARGDTETEMGAVLHFTLPQSALHSSMGALNADLTARGNNAGDEANGIPPSSLRVANALFGEQTYPFLPQYLTLMATDYGAGLQLVDFRNAPDAARQQINAWVAENTEDRIQNIVPEGAITEETRLALANAVYFKASWLEPFEEQATADAPFTLLNGETVTSAFMNQQESFRYSIGTAGGGYQAVELPYYAGGTSMLLILPEDFASFEAALDADTFNAVVDSMGYTEVRLALPKFTFEFPLPLTDVLQAMGMTTAFDADTADFSGMADIPPGTNLYIGAVLHKAFIAVDEKGTEAAAATVVIMAEATSAMPSEPLILTFDRPFIFAIRDTQTGALLFVGRVLNPAG